MPRVSGYEPQETARVLDAWRTSVQLLDGADQQIGAANRSAAMAVTSASSVAIEAQRLVDRLDRFCEEMFVADHYDLAVVDGAVLDRFPHRFANSDSVVPWREGFTVSVDGHLGTTIPLRVKGVPVDVGLSAGAGFEASHYPWSSDSGQLVIELRSNQTVDLSVLGIPSLGGVRSGSVWLYYNYGPGLPLTAADLDRLSGALASGHLTGDEFRKPTGFRVSTDTSISAGLTSINHLEGSVGGRLVIDHDLDHGLTTVSSGTVGSSRISTVPHATLRAYSMLTDRAMVMPVSEYNSRWWDQRGTVFDSSGHVVGHRNVTVEVRSTLTEGEAMTIQELERFADGSRAPLSFAAQARAGKAELIVTVDTSGEHVTLPDQRVITRYSGSMVSGQATLSFGVPGVLGPGRPAGISAGTGGEAMVWTQPGAVVMTRSAAQLFDRIAASHGPLAEVALVNAQRNSGVEPVTAADLARELVAIMPLAPRPEPVPTPPSVPAPPSGNPRSMPAPTTPPDAIPAPTPRPAEMPEVTPHPVFVTTPAPPATKVGGG